MSRRPTSLSRQGLLAALLLAGIGALTACAHPEGQSVPHIAQQASAASAAPKTRAPDMRPVLDAQQRALLNPAGLPSAGIGPWTVNPYRGQAGVVDLGRTVFHAACASCHGPNADPTPEAPDLRRLDGFCRKLKAPTLKDRCHADIDQHFMASVQSGMVRAGVMYMPSWKEALSPESIWAVRTYLETLRPPPPAVLPDRKAPPAP